MSSCRVILFIFLLYLGQNLAAQIKRNDRPIIGILAQEHDIQDFVSFIGMPYVKQMEASGARVVPVLVEQETDYYRHIVQDTNGLVLPGGNRNITHSAFQRAAEHLFRYITEANNRGEYYPIYGICQGMEMTTVLILQQWVNDPTPYRLVDCQAEDITLNLKFQEDPKDTRFFQDASTKMIDILKHANVTPNYHHQCMTPVTVNDTGLHKHLRILTTSKDSNGLEFVSTFESTNESHPIFLVQYHPEKVLEFKIIEGEQNNVPHSLSAVEMSQYFGNFFVDECRKNMHKYPTNESENEALIFNCNPIYTMSNSADSMFEREHFTQLYWFPSLTGCEGEEPFFNHNAIAIVTLSLVILILLGILVVKGIFSKRSQYTQIESEHI